jgi:hypothetical protein
MMAERSLAKNKRRQGDEWKKNKKVGDKTLDIADGEAVRRHIEKIYSLLPSRPYGQ